MNLTVMGLLVSIEVPGLVLVNIVVRCVVYLIVGGLVVDNFVMNDIMVTNLLVVA